jgi:hypothetical protein
MSKEPGQMAYEAQGMASWDRIGWVDRQRWRRVESAIRADERAKVVEECALAIDRDIHTYDSEMRSYAEGFAAAIRAKIGAEHE